MNAHSFERLIGIWETSGTVFHKEGNLDISGIDRYEYVLAGHYIKH